MKSRFGRHLLFWLILPVVLIFSAPAIPETGMFALAAEEEVANVRMLGAEEHQAARDRAGLRFSRWFIDPGWVRWSFQHLTSHGRRQVFAWAKDNQASGHYLTRLWLAVSKALYRLEIARYWLTSTLIVLIASLIDGIVCRKIKTYEFGYANPVAFHISSHGMLAVFGLFVVVPWLPFALQQWTWPVIIIIAAGVAWKSAESFQSGM